MLTHTHLRNLTLAAIISLSVTGCPTVPPKDGGSGGGSFSGLVHAKWLEDGRKMVLLQDVVFLDSNGVTWTAPVNATIDGASIPRIVWSIVGGPYEGKYRDASVVHDYECCVEMRPWRQVHRMFFDAMMARDEEPWRAKLMYWAVYHFGPRWPEAEAARPVQFTEDDVARAVEYFRLNPNVSLEEIERLNAAQLLALVPSPSPAIMSRNGLQAGQPVVPVDPSRPCFDGG